MHTMGGRCSDSSRPYSHPAIPDRGTWSISQLIQPSPTSTSSPDEVLTDAQLTKLHKLAALIPPARGGDEWQQLKSQLATMLRLVRGVHLATPHTHKHDAGSNASHSAVQIIDARPLPRHDPNWNTTLPPTSPTNTLHIKIRLFVSDFMRDSDYSPGH